LRCDLLVVNKIDLAPYVGVELVPMLDEARRARAGRPVIATNARSGAGIEAVADAILAAVLFHV
jgi:urease accessory protein